MAWNEPGGNKPRDPWGGGNNNNDGPPDLDEALKKFQNKINGIFGGGNGGGSSSSGGTGFGGLIAIGAFFAAIAWGLMGFYQIDEQEEAVILRLGVYHDTVGPGLKWNPPLIDSVSIVKVTTEEQYSTRGLMLTEDANIVDLPLTVQYRIADAKAYILNVNNPDASLRHATDSALRHVVGSSSLNQVLSEGRENIAVAVEDRLQTYLDNYGTGIFIIDVNIQEGKPPSAVKAAFDDVIKAREDEERFINEAQAYSNEIIPQARGKSQRLIEEANAYKAEVIAKAEGEAQRFEKLLVEYKKAPRVTRERLYIDAVQEVLGNSSKVLMDVEGGNNMMYLPLDKIVQQAPSNNFGSSASGSSEVSPQAVRQIAREVAEELRRSVTTRRTTTREGR